MLPSSLDEVLRSKQDIPAEYYECISGLFEEIEPFMQTVPLLILLVNVLVTCLLAIHFHYMKTFSMEFTVRWAKRSKLTGGLDLIRGLGLV